MFTDKLLNTAYSFAAAIVVFGAWAKLEHKDYGSIALTIGMLVESSIFFIYGLVEWRTRKSPAAEPEQQPAVPTPKAEPQPKLADVQRPADNHELAQTMERTNRILSKIFKVE